MSDKPQFRAAAFARREELSNLERAFDALHTEFHEYQEAVGGALEALNRTQVIFEQALVKTLEDMESLSDVLVDAGLLAPDDDGEEEVDDSMMARTDEEVEGDSLYRVVVDPDNPTNEAEVVETQEEHDARVAEVRERRMAAIQREAEEANESAPIEGETDPNSIADVPPEGIVVGEPRPEDLTEEVL